MTTDEEASTVFPKIILLANFNCLLIFHQFDFTEEEQQLQTDYGTKCTVTTGLSVTASLSIHCATDIYTDTAFVHTHISLSLSLTHTHIYAHTLRKYMHRLSKHTFSQKGIINI